MNSFLQSLTESEGIFSDPITLVITFLFVVILILIGFLMKLSQRVTRLMRGKHGSSFEETMISISRDIETIKTWQQNANELFTEIDERLSSSIRATSLIRFNPFKGTGSGGNQSFSAAFIDEEGTGIVVSSLYSRERVSLFGKPLKKFTSTFELTDEEKQAITEARKKLSE